METRAGRGAKICAIVRRALIVCAGGGDGPLAGGKSVRSRDSTSSEATRYLGGPGIGCATID
jgi:hypothetical protein